MQVLLHFFSSIESSTFSKNSPQRKIYINKKCKIWANILTFPAQDEISASVHLLHAGLKPSSRDLELL